LRELPIYTQIGVIAIGNLIPLIGTVLTVTKVTLSLHRDIVPLTFGILNFVVGCGIFRYGLMCLGLNVNRVITHVMTDAVMIVDRNLRIIYANSRAIDYFETTADEIIGEKSSTIFSDKLSLPKQEIETRTELSVNFAEEQRYIDVKITPIYNWRRKVVGRLIVWRDITDYKRVMNALQRREQQLATMVENSPVGMLLLDATGSIVECNARAAEIFGASLEELIGFNFITEGRSEQVAYLVGRALQGEMTVFEGPYISSTGGRTFILRAIFNPVTSSSKLTEIIAIIEDVTERKPVEDEPNEYQNHLENLVKQCVNELAEMQALHYREQQQLARSLHDTASQSLFSAHTLAKLLPRIIDSNPSRAKELSAQVVRSVRGALAEMRTLLIELRPEIIANSNLDFLIQQLADAFTGQYEIPVDLSIPNDLRLNSKVQIAFYWIVQESLKNIATYSKASHVEIRYRREEHHHTIIIRDDGVGFDHELIHNQAPGFHSMREQAQSIGVTIKFDTKIGQGIELMMKGSINGEEGSPDHSGR
jgi:PAS domain S-box-containing protein